MDLRRLSPQYLLSSRVAHNEKGEFTDHGTGSGTDGARCSDVEASHYECTIPINARQTHLGNRPKSTVEAFHVVGPNLKASSPLVKSPSTQPPMPQPLYIVSLNNIIPPPPNIITEKVLFNASNVDELRYALSTRAHRGVGMSRLINSKSARVEK